MYRYRYYLGVSLILFSSSVFAGKEEGKENDPGASSKPQVTRPRPQIFATPKRPKNLPLGNITNSNDSPVSKSKKELSPVRRSLLKEGYTPNGERTSVPKPVMENIFDQDLPPYPHVNFSGERVFLNMSLFDFEQTFLVTRNGSSVWKSNREIMKEGGAPICYRGHVDPALRNGMSSKEIFSYQKGWRVELHHLTLDMQGYGILMVVKGLHLGGDAAYLVQFDGSEITITQSGITKELRKTLNVENGFKVVCNVLHPANGKSEIDRVFFDSWRSDFWKALATGDIEITFPEADKVSLPPMPRAPKKPKPVARRFFSDDLEPKTLVF